MLSLEFKKAQWFDDQDGTHLSLLVSPNYRAAVKFFCLNMRDRIHTAILKEYKPRSLDANAYFWVLCDKLAEKTKIRKEEIYRDLIKQIGGNSETVCVRNKAVDKLRQGWEEHGIGWLTDTVESKIDGCTNVILYYGSSSYDSAQMARLIDLIVQECEQQDIETVSPEQISLLKENWK
ncbi:MAG: hypothetical protein SO119_10030 [Phascolarctobacterium sp.]|nr:hypothetical protein [Phascolarctobacterium sp.]